MAADFEQRFTPLMSPSGHGGLATSNEDWRQRGVDIRRGGKIEKPDEEEIQDA